MILGALFAAAGSVLVATATMMTKEDSKTVTYDNSVHNYNSHNKIINTATNNSNSTETKTNVRDSYKQQSTDIDHNKIIDELYKKYKLEQNEKELNELLEKLENLK